MESVYAQSRMDFVHKLSIAQKEASETNYWITLLRDSEYLKKNLADSLLVDCEELLKLLTSSIKTAKANIKKGGKISDENSSLITNHSPLTITMNFWLVKSEPDAYSYDELVKDGKTDWTGVRNFMARNNLKAMKKGDKVLYYHSVTEKAVVGLSKVSKEFFPDPTDEQWVAVELEPVKKFKKPVTLAEIKAQPDLANMYLVRQGRLSVTPLTKNEFDLIVDMAK
jgi:predicted RNA-binding protein with PUA-like domain